MTNWKTKISEIPKSVLLAKVIRRLMNMAITLLCRIGDGIIVLGLLLPCVVFIVLCALLIRLGRSLKNKPTVQPIGFNLLRLPEGSSDFQSIFNKYKSLDVYFFNTVPGFTNLVINSVYWTRNYYTIRLRKDYIAMETPHFSDFPYLSYLLFFCRNLGVIRKYRIDLIHANNAFREGLLAFVLSRIAGIPCCVSIHTDYDKCETLQPFTMPRIIGSLAITRRVEKFVLSKVDRILPISDYLRKVLLQKGVDGRKTRIFYHGIAMSFLNNPPNVIINELFNLPPQARTISSVGRIDLDHYIYDLLHVAMECVKKNDDVYFIIAGDGLELTKLRQMVREERLSDRILFPGMIPNQLALELRRQSVINVCFYDGFGLIEACASGKPVIAYDVEWNYELIVDGQTGFLIPENNTSMVIEKIDFLLTHPEEAGEMGYTAQQLAVARHSLDNVNKAKADIYLEILNGHKDGM